jgi:hypothetical protein
MRDLLKEHGMNWNKVAEGLGSNGGEESKTAMMCKKFYNSTKDRHGFAEIVADYKKVCSSLPVKSFQETKEVL